VKLETNLARIKKLAEQKDKENWEFRTYLKGCDFRPKKIDAIVHRLHAYVASKIDCRKCGNCCRELGAVMEAKDIARMAGAEHLTLAEFKRKYLEDTREKGRFVVRQRPCPFLSGTACRHYDIRPESCVEFPFLHKPDFTTRSIMVLWNLPLCPIVYNVYELLKAEVAELELLRTARDFNIK
jgi:Fe-S-cluster containining protein